MRKLLLICGIFAGLLLLMGCGGGGSSLEGRWEIVSIEERWDGESYVMDDIDGFFQFNDDGTGVLNIEGQSDNFTWSTNGREIVLNLGGMGNETATYRISGSTLTITFVEDGYTDIFTLRRVND